MNKRGKWGIQSPGTPDPVQRPGRRLRAWLLLYSGPHLDAFSGRSAPCVSDSSLSLSTSIFRSFHCSRAFFFLYMKKPQRPLHSLKPLFPSDFLNFMRRTPTQRRRRKPAQQLAPALPKDACCASGTTRQPPLTTTWSLCATWPAKPAL